MSSGGIRYGMIRSAGREQPLAVKAAPIPASLRKSRRLKTIESLIESLMMADQAIHAGRGGVLRLLVVLPVAGDAPPHLERRILIDDRHLLHRTVAGLTGDARQHVTLVIELHVVRQPIDVHPR